MSMHPKIFGEKLKTEPPQVCSDTEGVLIYRDAKGRAHVCKYSTFVYYSSKYLALIPIYIKMTRNARDRLFRVLKILIGSVSF